MLAEIPNTKMLMEFLSSRLDFWPFNFDDDKRDCLKVRSGCDLELSKVYSLYELIDSIGKPLARGAAKAAVQEEEKIDLRARGVVRKPRGKKKEVVE